MKPLVFCSMILVLASGLFAQASPDAAQAPAAVPAPASTHDVNYAFGLLIGQSLGTTGMSFDLDVIRQALQDSLDKTRKPLFDLNRAKQIVNEAVQDHQQKVAAEKIDQEKAYLADHSKVAGVVTTNSGLQYEILKAGSGPKPTPSDAVKVDYVGTLVDGTEFDSSIKRGEPAVFTLEQVIPAWTEGIQLMPVGSKYRFTVPSNLAYGAHGAGGIIPPYATLIFVVDLISIEPPAKPATEAPNPPAPPAQK